LGTRPDSGEEEYSLPTLEGSTICNLAKSIQHIFGGNQKLYRLVW
jgi:hypothetical protein